METFWEEFGDDERVTVLDRTDKKLVQLVHLFVEPLKSQAREHQGEQRADFRAGLGKDTSLNVDSTFKRSRRPYHQPPARPPRAMPEKGVSMTPPPRRTADLAWRDGRGLVCVPGPLVRPHGCGHHPCIQCM